VHRHRRLPVWAGQRFPCWEYLITATAAALTTTADRFNLRFERHEYSLSNPPCPLFSPLPHSSSLDRDLILPLNHLPDHSSGGRPISIVPRGMLLSLTPGCCSHWSCGGPNPTKPRSGDLDADHHHHYHHHLLPTLDRPSALTLIPATALPLQLPLISFSTRCLSLSLRSMTAPRF
jgi:hypothetical protein